MFLGTYSHSIDNKGRLIIPSKYRDEIGAGKLVVTCGWDGNLDVYTTEGFEKFLESLEDLDGSPELIRDVTRFKVANADECRLDAQGRILINQKLREFAHLEKDVVITGNVKSFEVWSADNWNEMSGKLADASEMRSALEKLRRRR